MWALLEDSRLRTILLRCKGRRSGTLTAVSRHAFEMIKSTPSVDSPCFQGSSPIAVPSRKSILHVPVYYYPNITNNIEEKGKMRHSRMFPVSAISSNRRRARFHAAATDYAIGGENKIRRVSGGGHPSAAPVRRSDVLVRPRAASVAATENVDHVTKGEWRGR